MTPILLINNNQGFFNVQKNGLIKFEYQIGPDAEPGFIQIHDAPLGTAPANGSVPLKVWSYEQDDIQYKEFKDGLLTFDGGIYVCLSSTLGTKTLLTGAANVFVYAQAELLWPQTEPGVVNAGDLTTPREQLTVFSDGQNPSHALLSLHVDSTSSSGYVMLFAKPPKTGVLPLLNLGEIADNGAQKNTNFNAGFFPLSQGADEVVHNGCYVAISSHENVYIPVGSATFHISAEYQ